MKQEQFICIRVKLMEQLRQGAEWSDEEILERIDLLVSETARENRLTVKQREEIRRELFYSVRKLDILQELLDDDRVTEIMVNGYQNIFVEREGKKSRWEKSFVSKEKLEDVVQQIAGKCNRVINENSPIVDARLENGSRVNAVIYPVALDGPILTIRRFPEHAITMEDLIAKESITREAAAFLEQMVKAGYSILIGGGTSSGKTTFLNALSNAIPHEERVITIEDSAELQIQGVENLVRLEAKPANMEGNRAITIRDLIRTALRMAPKVPLVKTGGTWMLSIQQLAKITELLKNSRAVEQKGMTYQEYLGILLMTGKSEVQTERTMDIVEAVIRGMSGKENFRLDQGVIYLEVDMGVTFAERTFSLQRDYGYAMGSD